MIFGGGRKDEAALYMLCGAIGVGKSATGRAFRDMLPNCAFLDGDWCWDMHPFRVTETTKRVVLDNICHALKNFSPAARLRTWCSAGCCTTGRYWTAYSAARHAGVGSVRRGADLYARGAGRAPSEGCGGGERDEGSLARALAYLPLYGELGVPLLGHLRLHSA